MKRINLRKYVQFHEQLVAEKAEIEFRLAAINNALGTADAPSTPRAKAAGRQRGTRRSNKASLKSFVLKALTKPMTRPEILNAVQGAGYKFSTRDPLNSLSTLLYSNKKAFKNNDGKFSAA